MKRDFWMLAAAAVLLGMLEFRLASLVGNVMPLKDYAEHALNITIGEPEWSTWQNRLLMPWLLRAIGETLRGGDLGPFYRLLMVGLYVGQNLLFAAVVSRLTPDILVRLRYLLYFSFATIAQADVLQLYLWDFVDIMAFTVFLYGAIRGKGDGFFAALFLVALSNRESALFIPLWLMLDSVALRDGTRFRPFPVRIRNRRRLLLGAGLLAGGVAVVQLLRHFLLVRELGPLTAPDFAAHGTIHFGWNLGYFLNSAPDYYPEMHVLRTISFFALPAFLFAARKRMDDLLFSLSLVVLAALAVILVHGLARESRCYSMLVPFLALMPFHYFHVMGKPAAQG